MKTCGSVDEFRSQPGHIDGRRRFEGYGLAGGRMLEAEPTGMERLAGEAEAIKPEFQRFRGSSVDRIAQ